MKNFYKSWAGAVVALIVTILMVSLATCASASEMTEKAPETFPEKVEKCTMRTVLKGYGWSALYGGVLLGGVTAIGIATAPVSIPTSVATGAIAYNTGIGALIGVGSSSVTRISDNSEIGAQHLVDGCAKKVAKEKVNEVKEAVKNGAAKAAEAGNSAIERAKTLVK